MNRVRPSNPFRVIPVRPDAGIRPASARTSTMTAAPAIANSERRRLVNRSRFPLSPKPLDHAANGRTRCATMPEKFAVIDRYVEERPRGLLLKRVGSRLRPSRRVARYNT